MAPWPTTGESRATTLILQLFLLSDTPTVIHSQQLSRFTFSKMQIEYQFKFCILYSFLLSTRSVNFHHRLKQLPAVHSFLVRPNYVVFIKFAICTLTFFWKILDVQLTQHGIITKWLVVPANVTLFIAGQRTWKKVIADLLIRIVTVCGPHYLAKYFRSQVHFLQKIKGFVSIKKNYNLIFRKWRGGGGVEGRFEFFRKFIRFGSPTRP